jgi:site-specific recombinase XerD
MEVPDKYKEIYIDYLNELKITGYRPEGIKGKRNKLPKLFKYMEEKQLTLQGLRVKEALNYQGWLIETGKIKGGKYSNRSINDYITTATNFYNYLKRKKLIHSNPFQDIRRPRNEFKIPKNILREKQIDELLKELTKYDECNKDFKSKKNKYRVHVISELMYATGLRISEVSNLKIEDIDFERGLVKVVEGKKGETRLAIMNDYAKEVLRLYIHEIRELVFNEWNKDNDRLFKTGKDCLEKLVNNILKKTSLKLSLPVITSHGFRHALGFHLLRSGCDIRYIQAILGHKRLTDTEIYTKVEKEDLKEVLDKYHPRTFLKRTDV